MRARCSTRPSTALRHRAPGRRRRTCLRRSTQPGDIDGDGEVAGRPTLVDALQWCDITVITTPSNNDMMDADGMVVRDVMADPLAVPPFDPRVALALDGLADRRVALGMHIARHVAGGDSEPSQESGAEMCNVLADALPSVPGLTRARLHTGRARHVFDGVVKPRRDA